jgi:hypothetical protein
MSYLSYTQDYTRETMLICPAQIKTHNKMSFNLQTDLFGLLAIMKERARAMVRAITIYNTVKRRLMVFL